MGQIQASLQKVYRLLRSKLQKTCRLLRSKLRKVCRLLRSRRWSGECFTSLDADAIGAGRPHGAWLHGITASALAYAIRRGAAKDRDRTDVVCAPFDKAATTAAIATQRAVFIHLTISNAGALDARVCVGSWDRIACIAGTLARTSDGHPRAREPFIATIRGRSALPRRALDGRHHVLHDAHIW